MKSSNNNGLRRGALFSLFITSYVPLFAIVIGKQIKEGWNYLCWGGWNREQIKEGWNYLCWGGWNREALICFFKHFGMSAVLVVISVVGVMGLLVLLHNLKRNLPNGEMAKVTRISNRNSEAIGYIATYIVPFVASDFSSLFECGIFVVVMGLIYAIYTNSNMILINPLLSIWYSLLEKDSSYIMAKKDDKVKEPSKLDEVLDRIKDTKQEDVKLHFITRILKSGVGKRDKTLDKYLFKVYQIDVDDEIRKYLYDLSIKELERTVTKDYSLIDYDPISDDTDHLFSYKLKAETSTFSDVVVNQLGKELPKVESIEGIISENEELWAYCIGFLDVEAQEWIYTFRKIMVSKIAIDEKNDTDKSIVWRQIRTIFNSTSKKLTLMKGEAVTLDKQIDCVYWEETFYVLKKVPFEQIVGLQEEYHAKAIEVVDEMKNTGLIDGLDGLEEELKTNTSLHKKLVKLQQNGGLEKLDDKQIKKMAKVCKRYGETISVGADGHIKINDRKDFETVIKAMCDYYKKGEVSGKSYGTFSGRELKEVEK